MTYFGVDGRQRYSAAGLFRFLGAFVLAGVPAFHASAQTYTGRIGAGGSSVPTTTAMTGATANPHIGIAPPPVNSATIRERLIIGNTIGHTIGR